MPVHFTPGASNEGVEEQYQAVSALLTQTAKANSRSSSTPVPVSLPTQVLSSAVTAALPAASPSSLPSVGLVTRAADPTQKIASEGGKAISAPCDLAQPGRPLDVTIPDDTHFYPGENFSKTWRLVNVGSCTWTRDYAVVWFSGSDLGFNRVQMLSKDVHSGGVVDITVDMVAPETPGTYQSNWKVRNPRGDLFGIGPKGDAPFWVRIVVVPVETPTTTLVVPTVTQPAVVFSSGSISLGVDEGADLDSAQKNQAENDDVVLRSPEEGHLQLAALNDAQLTPYGISEPRLADCQKAAFSSSPVPLESGQEGAYFCYRTSKGLPGRILIQGVDAGTGQIDLEFVTWVVP